MLDDQQISKYLDDAAAIVGVTIAPAHRDGVLGFFRLAATLAADLAAFDLPELQEPAPQFRPGCRSDVPPGEPR